MRINLANYRNVIDQPPRLVQVILDLAACQKQGAENPRLEEELRMLVKDKGEVSLGLRRLQVRPRGVALKLPVVNVRLGRGVVRQPCQPRCASLF